MNEATTQWKQTLENDAKKVTVEDLSQYECDLCEEKHYHTKRNVKTHKNFPPITLFCRI